LNDYFFLLAQDNRCAAVLVPVLIFSDIIIVFQLNKPAVKPRQSGTGGGLNILDSRLRGNNISETFILEMALLHLVH
jgi:hypothetical protein